MRANLGEVAQPEHLHFLLREGVGAKLGQLHKDEVEPVDDLFAVLHVHHTVVVVVALQFGLEDLVDEVEGVDGFQEAVVVALVALPDVGLGSVEEHALLKLRRPDHLHLHDELPAACVAAPDVDDAVFPERRVGHELGGQVFDALNLLLGPLEGQERVEEAAGELRVLAKHLFKGKVGFRVEVSHVLSILFR